MTKLETVIRTIRMSAGSSRAEPCLLAIADALESLSSPPPSDTVEGAGEALPEWPRGGRVHRFILQTKVLDGSGWSNWGATDADLAACLAAMPVDRQQDVLMRAVPETVYGQLQLALENQRAATGDAVRMYSEQKQRAEAAEARVAELGCIVDGHEETIRVQAERARSQVELAEQREREARATAEQWRNESNDNADQAERVRQERETLRREKRKAESDRDAARARVEEAAAKIRELHAAYTTAPGSGVAFVKRAEVATWLGRTLAILEPTPSAPTPAVVEKPRPSLRGHLYLNGFCTQCGGSDPSEYDCPARLGEPPPRIIPGIEALAASLPTNPDDEAAVDAMMAKRKVGERSMRKEQTNEQRKDSPQATTETTAPAVEEVRATGPARDDVEGVVVGSRPADLTQAEALPAHRELERIWDEADDPNDFHPHRTAKEALWSAGYKQGYSEGARAGQAKGAAFLSRYGHYLVQLCLERAERNEANRNDKVDAGASLYRGLAADLESLAREIGGEK